MVHFLQIEAIILKESNHQNAAEQLQAMDHHSIHNESMYGKIMPEAQKMKL